MNIAELGRLVDDVGKPVYGFCHRLAGNRADADDLYQDTFLKAVQLCGAIDPEGNVKGFLIGIAARLWKNGRRKAARRNRIAPQTEITDEDTIEGGWSPEVMVLARETKDALRNAAEALDLKLRVPLYMYYTADMSVQEIASALKIPQGTVKSRLNKARQKLRGEMEEEYYYEARIV